MLYLYFGNTQVRPTQKVPYETAQIAPSVYWNSPTNGLYTLMIYDMSASNVSPDLLFLAVNVPNSQLNKSDVLLPFQSFQPAVGSGAHTYVVDLFQQTQRIPALSVTSGEFDVINFTQVYGLQHINRLLFMVDSPFFQSQILTRTSNSNNNSNKESWLSQGLSEKEQKYCRCVLHVAGKQPEQCNRERAWFQEREGSTCYNPYSTCAKSVGTTFQECGENYNFEMIPDDELIGYASLNKISIPSPYNRAQLLKNILSI